MTSSTLDPDAVAIGRAARGALTTAGITLADAAERTGIPLRTLSRCVNGGRCLSFTELIRIAEISGVRVSEIAAAAERSRENSGSAA